MEASKKTTRRVALSCNILHGGDCVAKAAPWLAIVALLLLLSATCQAEARPAGGVLAEQQLADGEATPVNNNNNWAMLRLRRQIAPIQQQSEAAQERQNERELIKRPLPDLIAQAHNDKLAERALLKLLIEASLRSSLGNFVSAQAAEQQVAAGGGSAARLVLARDQLAALAADQLAADQLAADVRQLQQPSGKLERLGESVGDQQQQWAPLGATDQDTGSYGPMQTVIDKREYSKPCSFNAISCVRTPFRRL